jgi:UrcA family protein
MNINRRIAAHCISLALIAAASPAAKVFAAPPDPSTTRTATLTFSDLDLSRAADVQIARERIRLMATKLCEKTYDPLSLSHHEAFLDCVASATAGAEPKLEQLAAAQKSAVTLAARR